MLILKLLKGNTVLLSEFATKHNKGMKFLQNFKNKYGWTSKKYRNKSGIRTEGNYSTTENHGKERLEDYSTSVA